MSSPRTLARAITIAAVVALSAVFAVPAGSQSATTDEPPHGVAVPGLTADKVSGEAQGARATLRLDLASIIASADAASAAGIGDTTPGFAKNFFAGAASDAGAHAAVSSSILSSEVGFDPEVELPALGGGPLKDQEDSVKLEGPFGPFSIAKDLVVKTQGAIGDTGYSHSESTVHETNGPGESADEVDVECSADLTGVRGSTEVKEGDHLTSTFGTAKIPNQPDPNEELADFTIDVPGLGTIITHFSYQLVANEQDKDDHSITITGLHENFRITTTDTANPSAPPVELERAETWFGRAHCDIDPVTTALVVEPKFTG